jgi:pilus assembly protein Flp/PilA
LAVSHNVAKTIAERALDLLRDEQGPTATEYAIMLALLILGVMATIQAIGQSMQAIYEDINAAVGETGAA